MATTSLQTEVKLIHQKKALYTKRMEDAQKRNRPDIEKIWRDEIKVLDEKLAKLNAKEKGEKINNNSSGQPTAKQKRKLRQLNNQIDYVKRKIAIHKERGEAMAVQKQMALLLDLEAKKSKLVSANAQSMRAPSRAGSRSAQPAHTLTSAEKRELNTINSEIAYAEKMIREYQKYNSPKAETWIGKKFQLVSQRDKLLKGVATTSSSFHTAPPEVPEVTAPPAVMPEIITTPTISTQPPPIQPSFTAPATATTSPVPPPLHANQQLIAEAQEINRQIRVIDLEIAHADKMIREYQKYRSPKANQWIHRKNELLARRNRITGKINHQQATLDANAANQKRLRIITLELAHADKMIKEYQKYNSPKAHDWIARRNDLLAEKAMLEGNVISGISQPNTPHPRSTNREVIKAQILEFNRKAKEADNNMRAALRRGDHQQAEVLHQQRDRYNQQARQLTAQLNGGSIPPVIPDPVQPPAESTGHSSNTQASALEKSIALKYLRTRNYTEEHAYTEVINALIEEKHATLSAAKETLFDITSASQLPPRNTVIDTPFVRDCFKIKVSDVLLDGYTINDTIFDTRFPDDFDAMIKRINQHIGPAPELKAFRYLAHRDAIQLIPSDPAISQFHSQFAGAILKNVTIRNIRIKSKGALQGLFASDGSFRNLHLENIIVETNSAHQIAILGLLSGTLDLSSPSGVPVHIKLLPLRLAGGHNIYINSFSRNSSYQYEDISVGHSNAVISDDRKNMKKRGIYYKNFDMDAFLAAMRRANPSTNIFDTIKIAAERAGTITKVV